MTYDSPLTSYDLRLTTSKIVFTGSESTAKTSISAHLAKEMHFDFVPEFAREYLDKLQGKNYTCQDVIAIAEEQRKIEKKWANSRTPVLFDTDLLTIKIWLEYYDWQLPDWLNEFLQNHKADLYLLMKPDIAWQADTQRKNPHDRDYLFAVYERELQKLNAHYRIITGVGEERIGNCRREIEAVIARKKQL